MTRYVITPRDPGDELSMPQDDRISVVVPLDRGLLVDGEPGEVKKLAHSGWRVKKLPDPHVINLFSYRIDTEKGTLPEIPEEFSDLAQDDSDNNHLVQFVGPVQESWLSVLDQRGVAVTESLGSFAYYVRAGTSTVEALRGLPFIAWTGRFLPAYKVNPVLFEEGIVEDSDDIPGAPGADGPLGTIEAMDIGVLADADVDGVAKMVIELGGSVQAVGPETTDTYRSVTGKLPPEAIPVIASHPDVRWIDAVRRPVLEDERTAQIAFEDLDGAAPPNTAPVTGYVTNLSDLGVDGSGVTIAICDTGIDTNDATTVHADLAGRLSFAVPGNGGIVGTDTNGHGTHVAGIAAGDGGSGDTDPQGFVLGQGLAPNAHVGSVYYRDGTRQQKIQAAAEQGADIMNNSYTLNGPTYSASDRAMDLGVRDADPTSANAQPLVVVFAAGNSGPGDSTCTCAVKNAIVVGNSLNFRPGEGDIDDIRGLRTSSSRGPSGDGRLHPHLVAPGTNVVSARSASSSRDEYIDTAGTIHPDHTETSGTSMAAPLVSGMCALLIDWWRRSRGGATPSPALLKALLVSSTESVEGGPDRNGGTIAAEPTNDAGWGRVSIENTLLQHPASDHGPKIFHDQRHAFTASGQEYRIRVAAADPSRPLRVTLAWTDAPGAVGANPALVNDLDLEVVENSTGDLFRGNVLTNGFSTTGGIADSLNNLECAFIENPSGLYEVSVVASNIAESARPDIAIPWQDFALVIDNGEVPAVDPVSVVTLLDRSGSMRTFGYIDVARQTTRQFVDLMSVGDSVGVVSFGSDAEQEFPSTGGPALITGQSVRDAATGAIDAISFGGCTFMGDGIQAAGSMLRTSGSRRRAIVLMSDGYDNKGCDPGNSAKPGALDAAATLPVDLPLYTCAMGPASDQTLLGQLADDTDGRYYFMPTIDDLFEIYNYVRGQVTGDGIIINESSMASRSTTSGFVDACTESALFTVAWHDESLHYIDGEPIKPNEITMRLRTPGGRWLPQSATEIKRTVGSGYVSLELQDPQPGLWTVEVATARRQHTPYTVGGFVRSSIGLDVVTPSLVSVGEPVHVRAMVRDGQGLVGGFKVRGSVSSPRQPIEAVLRKFARELKNIRPPKQFLADGHPNPEQVALAQLTVLRDQMVAKSGIDMLAPAISRLSMSGSLFDLPRVTGRTRRQPPLGPWAASGDPSTVVDSSRLQQAGQLSAASFDASTVTTHRTRLSRNPGWEEGLIDFHDVFKPRPVSVSVGRVDHTKIPGSYSIKVEVTGFSTACNSRFVRQDLVSVAVADSKDPRHGVRRRER